MRTKGPCLLAGAKPVWPLPDNRMAVSPYSQQRTTYDPAAPRGPGTRRIKEMRSLSPRDRYTPSPAGTGHGSLDMTPPTSVSARARRGEGTVRPFVLSPREEGGLAACDDMEVTPQSRGKATAVETHGQSSRRSHERA